MSRYKSVALKAKKATPSMSKAQKATVPRLRLQDASFVNHVWDSPTKEFYTTNARIYDIHKMQLTAPAMLHSVRGGHTAAN